MGRSKQRGPAVGAPAWMVTYGDTMTLLLCFFVIIVSMSEVKEDEKFARVMESLRKAFGGYAGSIGTMPIDTPPLNSLLKKLLEIELPRLKDITHGDTDVEGIHGKKFRVTNVRDGIEVVVGGTITFPRFSAVLMGEGRMLIAKTAKRIRGYNTKILVRGHATREMLPDDSLYADGRDLSYARARAVMRELELHGVRNIRLIPVALGNAEPLVQQAYTEQRRALNRRVEILVTEDLIDDFAGSTLADEMKESSDG